MPHRRRRFLRVVRNPILVISMVAALITVGWLTYVNGTGSITQARNGENLFTTLQVGTEPSSDATMSSDSVDGWRVSTSGDAETSLTQVEGQLHDDALELDITRYNSGDVTLTSPRVEVDPRTTYLFKAFTSSDADYTLLVREYRSDGGTTLTQLQSHGARPNDPLSTIGDAFDSADTTSSVEYVLRFASTATARVEGAYFEAADDVVVPAVVPTSPNLIPGLGVTGPRSGDTPDAWSPYVSGALTMESAVDQDEDGNFLRTHVTNYRSGEAKWQYEPVPVATDRYLHFEVTYRSERKVDVVAEFELQGGGRSFSNLVTMPPAGEWTTVAQSFHVPDGATTTMVTVVSHGDGTTEVRGHSLTDVTTPGPGRWDRPMVSITFDDGRKSTYDTAVPLLEEHGFLSTQYVNPGTIETPDFMSAAGIQRLHEDGHEIAAHGYRDVDLTSVGADRLDEELRRAQEALVAAGIETGDLALPLGRSDPQVDWYASRYYDTVRGTDQGINTRQNLDASDLRVFYVTDETTPDSLAAALTETSRTNGWLILVYHQIAASGSDDARQSTITADRSTITSDALASQLQLIHDSGIEVQPVAQAFDILQDQ